MTTKIGQLTFWSHPYTPLTFLALRFPTQKYYYNIKKKKKKKTAPIIPRQIWIKIKTNIKKKKKTILAAFFTHTSEFSERDEMENSNPEPEVEVVFDSQVPNFYFFNQFLFFWGLVPEII